MYRIYFIILIQITLLEMLCSQAVPRGMNYQAVAYDDKGEIISNQKISLKISLFGLENDSRKNHYIEIHEVITNPMGLFNLEIGAGLKESGEYGLVPWNEENIWLEVAIRDKGKNHFTSFHSNKLQAVPYAIHADLADRLIQIKSSSSKSFAPPQPGVISTDWSVLGNAKTDASGNLFRLNSLGTSDFVDLIMITDNVERLRILAGGDIITKLNFEVGKNLNVLGNVEIQKSLTVGDSLIVKKNVLFNILGGNTNNYGPFTVANVSPTLFTGILEIDGGTTFNTALMVNGTTDLNSRLYVNKMSPTKLTGTLQVDKSTDLNDALNVNNMSPTHLSGTLTVDKSTQLNDSLNVFNISPTLMTGTLRVDKATDLNDSLSILNMSPTRLSGPLTVQKEAYFLNKVMITDSTQSLDKTGGALVIVGGLGIGKNFNVGGSTAFSGPVTFNNPVKVSDVSQSTSPLTGAVKVSGGMGILKNLFIGGMSALTGMTSILDGTQSTSSITGALKVTGGVGIGKNLNIGGTSTLNGMMSITNATESFNKSTGALIVTGGAGIGLRLNVGGMTTVEDLTQSTSETTGALKVTGGTGIGLQLNVGGMASFLNNTESTSSSSGSLIVNGGVGIQKQLSVDGMMSVMNAVQVKGGVGIDKNLFAGGALTVTGMSTLNGGATITGLLKVKSSTSFITDFVNTTNANGISIQLGNSAPNKNNVFVDFRKNDRSSVGRIKGENSTEYMSNPTYVRELAILESRKDMADLLVAQHTINLAMAIADVVAAYSSSTPCFGVGACATFPIPSSIAFALVKLALRTAVLVGTVVGLNIAKDQITNLQTYKANTYGVTYESGTADYAEWLPKADPEESLMPGHIVEVKNGRVSKNIDGNGKLLVISTKPIVLGNIQDKSKNAEVAKVAFLGQVPVQVLGKVNLSDYILPSGYQDGMGRAVHPSAMQAGDYDKIVGVAWSEGKDDFYNIINTAIGLNTNDIQQVVLEQENAIHSLEMEINESNALLSERIPGYKEAMGLTNNATELQGRQSNASSNTTVQSAMLTSDSPYLEFTSTQLDETLKFAEKIVEANGKSLKDNTYWNQMKNDPNLMKKFNDSRKNIQDIILKQ
jgi:hypothetical protein